MCPILEETLLWVDNVLWSLKDQLSNASSLKEILNVTEIVYQNFINTLPETTSPLFLMEQQSKSWNMVSIVGKWEPHREEESWQSLPSLPLPYLLL